MPETIVILGAGWTGLPLAHKLLKYTLPKKPILVILVTPNTHFFWNVAATRGLIPGEFSEDQLFLPIAPGFAKYPPSSFELVLGTAQSIDATTNTVSVLLNTDGVCRTVSYDQLVIATGSRVSGDMPLKGIGTHKETLAAWRALQSKIGQARDIVIAGSGPTGVEVAGELAAKYGRTRSITLVMSGTKPLENHASVLPSVISTAEGDLLKLGVKLLRGKRVNSVSTADTGTKLTFSDGSEMQTDCYLPLFGLKTNTSFVPPAWLDSEGNVSVDDHFRVIGTGNAWALGDVGSMEPKQITITDNQIMYLAEHLDALLTGAPPSKAYEPEKKTLIFLSLGKSYATGQVGNWRLFGFLVSWVKGRRLFTDAARAYVGGEKLRHSSL
ncbi:Pyridine nucleotide-disulfide oxidoreductase, FAD/NAD(P)-binding domain protein [Akanthomyces lecanii RCEF 1005]|uniref:Pyridine nucleotide-disulfide oxidoreductase, FAD/NAD(P)-binding domain protein n=1 Tax=Akanthomyces lecanii RCEF 1005 TaxID=1081108 RepID=A0A168FBM2_CORDF|nr:Pyridine nucleotide-disulfide oxidoreductase, FAD/NAD(P)-binding domain protein [Akanthomyces lecanii RCEF 1005]